MNDFATIGKLSTMWNGMVLHVVPAGTRVCDPRGAKPDIIVDETTVACLHRALYCTASTEAKNIAKNEAKNRSRQWAQGEEIA